MARLWRALFSAVLLSTATAGRTIPALRFGAAAGGGVGGADAALHDAQALWATGGRAIIDTDAVGGVRARLTPPEARLAGALWTKHAVDVTEMAAIVDIEVGASGAPPGSQTAEVGPDGQAPALQSSVAVFLARNTAWVQG